MAQAATQTPRRRGAHLRMVGTPAMEPKELAGFATPENAVVRRSDLSRDARLTYVVLKSYAWDDGRCFPSMETLEADLGASRKSVYLYLHELEQAGIIRIERRGLKQSNVYHLLCYESPVTHNHENNESPVTHSDAPSPGYGSPVTHPDESPVTHPIKEDKTQFTNTQSTDTTANAVVGDAPPPPSTTHKQSSSTERSRSKKSTAPKEPAAVLHDDVPAVAQVWMWSDSIDPSKAPPSIIGRYEQQASALLDLGYAKDDLVGCLRDIATGRKRSGKHWAIRPDYVIERIGRWHDSHEPPPPAQGGGYSNGTAPPAGTVPESPTARHERLRQERAVDREKRQREYDAAQTGGPA